MTFSYPARARPKRAGWNFDTGEYTTTPTAEPSAHANAKAVTSADLLPWWGTGATAAGCTVYAEFTHAALASNQGGFIVSLNGRGSGANIFFERLELVAYNFGATGPGTDFLYIVRYSGSATATFTGVSFAALVAGQRYRVAFSSRDNRVYVDSSFGAAVTDTTALEHPQLKQIGFRCIAGGTTGAANDYPGSVHKVGYWGKVLPDATVTALTT